MNHARTAIAVSVLALSAATFGATQASARLDPEPQYGNTTPAPNYPEYNYPEYKLDVPTVPTEPDCHWAYHPACHEIPAPVPPVEATLDPGSSDDNGAKTMQTGASALGGAGIALGAVWIYRRRQAMGG